MQTKKVIATQTGWKNKQLYVAGDVFEVAENENATWFEDAEVKTKPKAKKQQIKEDLTGEDNS